MSKEKPIRRITLDSYADIVIGANKNRVLHCSDVGCKGLKADHPARCSKCRAVVATLSKMEIADLNREIAKYTKADEERRQARFRARLQHWIAYAEDDDAWAELIDESWGDR